LLPQAYTDDVDHDDISARQPFLSSGRRDEVRNTLFRGNVGGFLFSTKNGWRVYVAFISIWLMGTSIGLLVVNWLVLLTGVYKFSYPMTLTFINMFGAHLLLWLAACLTRLLSGLLRAGGLAGMIAPSDSQTKAPRASYGARRGLVSRVCSFSRIFVPGIAGGGFLEFELSAVRQTWVLAVVYVLRSFLSNISYAYAQLPMYVLARIAIVPLTALFTSIAGPPHSVPLVSAVLAATLNLLVACLQGNISVTSQSVAAGIASSFFAALFPILLLRTYRVLLRQINPTIDPSTTNPYTSASPSGTADEARATWQLLHYTSLLSLLLFAPLVLLSGEVGNIARNCYFLDEWWHWFMMWNGSLGTFSVLIGYVLVVKATSPLTANFLSVPKYAFLLPILASFKLPVHAWVGVVMAFACSGWFVAVRMRESRRV
jgi:hypothetical protein